MLWMVLCLSPATSASRVNGFLFCSESHRADFTMTSWAESNRAVEFLPGTKHCCRPSAPGCIDGDALIGSNMYWYLLEATLNDGIHSETRYRHLLMFEMCEMWDIAKTYHEGGGEILNTVQTKQKITTLNSSIGTNKGQAKGNQMRSWWLEPVLSPGGSRCEESTDMSGLVWDQ